MYAPEPRLYFSASARIAGLKEAVARFRLITYPTDAPKLLLDVLDHACNHLQQLADEHLEDWNASILDRPSIHQALQFLSEAIGDVGEYLSIFETAAFDKARPEIALPLEILINEHIPTSKINNHQFVFHATYAFNFFYRHFYQELRKRLLLLDDDDAQEFFRNRPEHIALVALAAIERDNIFTLIILLHELAHYWDKSQSPAISDIQLSFSRKAAANREWVEEAKRIEYVPEAVAASFPDRSAVPEALIDFALRVMIIQRVATARIWIRELVADIVAARIGGIAFYLTLKKFLGFIEIQQGSVYPPNYRRYHAVADVLFNAGTGTERELNVEGFRAKYPRFASVIQDIIAAATNDLRDDDLHRDARRNRPDVSASPSTKWEYLEYKARLIIEDVIAEPLRSITEEITRQFPDARCCKLSERMLDAATYLIERMPPAQLQVDDAFQGANALRVDDILGAAWLAWLAELRPDERSADWIRRRRTVSRLALRGIELSDYLSRHGREDQDKASRNRDFGERRAKACDEIKRELNDLPKEAASFHPGGGVVGRRDLLLAMARRPIGDRLVIMPVLDPRQIGDASVDLRLGNGFIAVRPTRTPRIRVGPGSIQAPGEFKEEIALPYGKTITLHPGEFILGSVLEYICLPRDMMAYVIGKSSLGRLGLIIATATHVAPGYKGTLTLELSNVGTVPIELRPRTPIAQLVFHYLREPVEIPYHLRGSFTYSTGPEMPRLEHLEEA
ncbi:MAG: dCTP deaminase [Chloroflexi bacterium]|nr:dCTP deaminase [Chloroflexota bacterium]